MYLTTRGLVLRTTEYKETDRIQTILTCTSVESAVLKGFEYSKITVKNGVLKGL